MLGRVQRYCDGGVQVVVDAIPERFVVRLSIADFRGLQAPSRGTCNAMMCSDLIYLCQMAQGSRTWIPQASETQVHVGAAP
jgi:hypothetical protein